MARGLSKLGICVFDVRQRRYLEHLFASREGRPGPAVFNAEFAKGGSDLMKVQHIEGTIWTWRISL